MSKDDIVLISTADWDNPFWTNKQHVAVELARRGHKVLYVDSLAIRQPSASGADLKRIVRRVRRGLAGPRKVRENLWVWSPLILPLHRYPWVVRLNRLLLRMGLARCLASTGMKPGLCWTYNPKTHQLIKLDRFARVVFHCVDEIKAQPDMPVAELECAERELVSRSDICFVTSQHLLDTRQAWNDNTHYFPNVADFSHFQSAMGDGVSIHDDLARIPGPRIGFIGALSAYKVDFELISEMARRHPEWSIVLIGKVGEGERNTDVSRLKQHANIHLLGPRPYGDLPGYLKGLDVAILPCRINDYTRAMFPMKFFEYLAAGKPVVSTQLHALRDYGHVARLAGTHDEFIEAVAAALRGEGATLDARLEAAREQTYEVRTQKMLDLIYGRSRQHA
ncbi:glycosyltransferase [Caballeronia sp. J97]|uniref:glycosyltransferase n=1 Tax=Caballeronia sp. J97 TaxID=2805429 RepID=UPI002AB1F382|nr:glycosyltransferase [Caballeronia sp. J97]